MNYRVEDYVDEVNAKANEKRRTIIVGIKKKSKSKNELNKLNKSAQNNTDGWPQKEQSENHATHKKTRIVINTFKLKVINLITIQKNKVLN